MRHVHPILVLIPAALLAGAILLGATDADSDATPDRPDPAVAATPDFGMVIRPLLSNRCFVCHGPDPGSREADLRLDRFDDATATLPSGRIAIVPGDADASTLLHRVGHHRPGQRMPPLETGAALTESEIDALRRWIDAGADYDVHWAFVAPERPAVPAVPDASDPIDAFVRHRLTGTGLTISPPADRATIIRRVTLDLIGLPPTPDDVARFVNDSDPGAYERVVDRLLDSPHFGERWASRWLDLARYADTKGYEADRRRTIWPYRDWVIRAFNDDLPFDEFTTHQIAGDLLPDPTIDQLVATAFHRNTMTNDEGGTDNEEFRSAAVVDRVNTTMQAWMGMTMACAQCHTHKYDPIAHDEYYEFYDFFNHTADNDEMDERPLLAVPSADVVAKIETLTAERDAVDTRIDEVLTRLGDAASITEDDPRFADLPARRDFRWIDDEIPLGGHMDGRRDTWTWTEGPSPAPHAGGRSIRVEAKGDMGEQVFFIGATRTMDFREGDRLFAHVFLDPANPPREIMLQFHTVQQGWMHRAYWGEHLVKFGTEGTTSLWRHGDLPPAGQWVRLEVDPTAVGLGPDLTLDGWAFTQHGGVVHWDDAGLHTAQSDDPRFLHDFSTWRERAAAGRVPELDAAILEAARSETDADTDRARHYFLREVSVPARAPLAPLAAERKRLDDAIGAASKRVPSIPVMRELPDDARRTTHIHLRGSFLDHGDVVSADVPEAFHPFPDDVPRNRVGLARWLVARDNPLTARVYVNRTWEAFFGTGLVETSEDFGIQGARPSHPDLLDWLAVEFMDNGWSTKSLCRTIVTSATYRRASETIDEARTIDPYNRLLSRGPRYRLSAEMIRDQALAVAGLLDARLLGPPVFPPQPDGLWMVVYSNDRWTTSEGPDRYLRGLYTFWRRTSPYPSMVTFDAPSREFCVTRRLRTNTPLQALVTLNDPVFIAAARGLATNALDHAADDDARLAFAFLRCTARPPTDEERRVLADLLAGEREHFRTHPDAASELVGETKDHDAVELAAWTVVGNVLLNLDEVLVKR